MGIRVLIADDHRLTMEAIKGYLAHEDGIKVVAEARSGRQALALVARANPDVALIDMHTARLHTLFGVLLLAGLIGSRIFG